MMPLPFLSYCPLKAIKHFSPELSLRHNPHVATAHITTYNM